VSTLAAQLDLGTYAAWVVGLEVTFALAYVVVALGIFVRRTHKPVAVFVAFMLVAWGTTFPPTMLALPAASAHWFWPVAAVRFTGAAAITLFFYNFPDGRFQPAWASWLATLWIGSQVPKYFAPQSLLNPDHWSPFLLAGASAGFLAVMVALQDYRYRWVSNAAQRRQTKWAVLGIASSLSIYAALLLFQAVDAAAVQPGTLGYLLFLGVQYACILLIPLSLAVAILRDRLFDIDLLINRTLVYGTLTVTLSLVYAASVIVLQQILHALTPQPQNEQPFIIVASTLGIAALFQPLRGRIQRGIDRRFFRSRYNAAITLAAFGAAMRDELDLAELTDHLLAGIEDAIEPSHVSLWLVPLPDGDSQPQTRIQLPPAEPLPSS
jgi:hypothetical protein